MKLRILFFLAAIVMLSAAMLTQPFDFLVAHLFSGQFFK